MDTDTKENLEKIVDQAISDLIDIGVFKLDTMIGCTSNEVDEVAQSQGVERLPFSYVYFLKKLGRQYGKFMVGDFVFYPDVLELKDFLLESMNEHSVNFLLNKHDFIFWAHLNMEYFWFDVNDDNPTIKYWYTKNSEVIELGKFSDILMSWVAYHQQFDTKYPGFYNPGKIT